MIRIKIRTSSRKYGHICKKICIAFIIVLWLIQVICLMSQGPITQPIPRWREHILANISQETDNTWVPVLKHGKITFVYPFSVEEDAISEKHLVILDDRYKAILKTVDSSSLARYPIIDLSRSFQPIKRRADRRLQGVPELIATHLDRVLGFYRKPPVAGRVISNKELYQGWPVTRMMHVASWRRALRYLIARFSPTYYTYVVLQPWMGKMENAESAYGIMNEFLANPSWHGNLLESKELVNEAKQISDVLVFDFLVDDHDRRLQKNWMKMNNMYLSWDSGLGWTHGPVGFSNCLDILCGIDNHSKQSDAIFRCNRVFRFSKSTISLLMTFAENGSTGHDSLGEKLRKSLESDVLYPAFHLIYYEHEIGDSDFVQFKVADFFKGMNSKVDKLLKHYQQCVSTYGMENVLL